MRIINKLIKKYLLTVCVFTNIWLSNEAMWQRRTFSAPLVRHVQVHIYRNLTYFTDYAYVYARTCVATLPRAHCCLLRLWLPIKVDRVIIFGKTIQTYCTVKNSLKKHTNFSRFAENLYSFLNTSQWAHDIRNVYITFYKRSRNIPMSNVRKTFQKRSKNVFRTLDIGMFLKRL